MYYRGPSNDPNAPFQLMTSEFKPWVVGEASAPITLLELRAAYYDLKAAYNSLEYCLPSDKDGASPQVLWRSAVPDLEPLPAR